MRKIKINFLTHAVLQLKERGIKIARAKKTVANPEQIIKAKGGRRVAQRRFFDSQKGKTYLLRVIFKERNNQRTVITGYRTSKVEKYWKGGKR